MARKDSNRNRADQIAAGLSGLPPRQAAAVLAQAQVLVLGAGSQAEDRPAEGVSGNAISPLLARGPKGIFERHPEVLSFLNGLDRSYGFNELSDLCRAKLGPIRGLSKSSLHKHIRRLEENHVPN